VVQAQHARLEREAHGFGVAVRQEEQFAVEPVQRKQPRRGLRDDVEAQALAGRIQVLHQGGLGARGGRLGGDPDDQVGHLADGDPRREVGGEEP
jgi:hypothetical protein